jgi:outer membrane protein TolC
MTILVDNKENIMASAIQEQLKAETDRMKLPEGTSISFGGDYEAQQEVFIPMGIALAVSILLIFFILLIQFRKIKIALLIMSGMLLTLPGAALGLLVMHYPFSVTAFIGITSLCGMVVRNGIILIDYARELHENQGMTTRDAALAAGKRRMRPIFLTSAAAGIGVVPMILSRSALWGPLGTVICFGLLVAMVLTLYLMPLLYSFSYSDGTRRQHWWSLPGKTVATLTVTVILLIGFSLKSFSRNPVQKITLDSCKQLALKNNRKIREAELSMQSARHQRLSVIPNFFPKIGVTALAMRSSDYLMKLKTPEMNLPVWDGKNPLLLMNPTQFAYVPSLSLNLIDYFNTAAVTATLPVYAGGRVRNGYRLASLGEDVSEMKKELTEDEVISRTEELFWTLQSLRARIGTIEQYRIMLDTLYQDVSIYAQTGLTHRNDLLKVQLKQNELKTKKMALSNGIELTTRALCQHIGVPYDSALLFADSITTAELVVSFSDPEELVKNRTEYQLLNKAIEAGKLQKRLTIGENIPTIALSGAGFTYDVMENTSTNALAMVSLNIPLTDWWSGAHKIKMQKMEIEKTENSLAENSELMALQIRQAAIDVKESGFRISVMEISVEQARENLKISRDNYNAGTIGISDLLEAQAVYQQAMDDLADARCQYQNRLSKYRMVAGM